MAGVTLAVNYGGTGFWRGFGGAPLDKTRPPDRRQISRLSPRNGAALRGEDAAGRKLPGVGEPNGRCRLPGGKSTGPRTAEGLERCRTANWKHGRYSREVVAERRGMREVLQDCGKFPEEIARPRVMCPLDAAQLRSCATRRGAVWRAGRERVQRKIGGSIHARILPKREDLSVFGQLAKSESPQPGRHHRSRQAQRVNGEDWHERFDC